MAIHFSKVFTNVEHNIDAIIKKILKDNEDLGKNIFFVNLDL